MTAALLSPPALVLWYALAGMLLTWLLLGRSFRRSSPLDALLGFALWPLWLAYLLALLAVVWWCRCTGRKLPRWL